MILKKGFLKKGLLVVLAFVMVFALCACGSEKPDKAVSNALDALKAGDAEKVDSYMSVTYADLTEGMDADLAKALFANLSYKVTASDVKDTAATVTVDITNTDMVKALTAYFEQALALSQNPVDAEGNALEGEALEAQMKQLLVDALSNKEAETVTTTVTVALTQVDKAWKITVDDALIAALMGGDANFSITPPTEPEGEGEQTPEDEQTPEGEGEQTPEDEQQPEDGEQTPEQQPAAK